MSVLILTILSISAVFVCNVDVCVAVWRYKNILENDLLFNTRSTIILEYEGSSFVRWEYPNACEVQNESSPNTVMTCRVSGIYSIKPLVYGTDEDKRQLHISDSFFCFVWYVVEEPPEKTINSTQLESANAKVIRVWAMDPENADPRERNNTALYPSRNSVFISRQFFSMGQDPIVEINDTWTIHFSFNFAEGHWQYLPTSLGIIPKLWISGKPINFQDCFIMSRSWSISTYYEEGQPNDSEFPLILPRGSSLLLTWYTCFFDKAILFTDSGTFITHNGFLKIEEIRVVLVGIPPPASGSFTVTDAAFLETGILFLIEDRIYKRESTRELWQVGEAQNIPASGVQGLQSRTSCSTNNYPSINVEFSKVAVWTANELYLGNDKNKTKFVKKADLALFTKILRLPSNYSVTITAVAYGSRPPELGVLVEACYVCDSTDKRLFLIIYNEETDTWIRSAFLAKLKPHSVPQGPFKMKFILSAWPSLLLWNDELMFYSYKNNSEYGNLHMSGSSNLRLLSGGSRIHQVILDDSWNVVVKMANNVFFYCKAGMDELIRLHSWEEKSTNMIFYLNNNGHLLVLKFNGSKLEPHRYPLDMEVKSSISTVCTYLTFQHSMNKPWYFIDKGEQLEFWALIIYPENMGMNLQTFGYRLDLLQMKTRTQFENAYQICSKNMTIAFHHDRDYINAEKYTELISQTSGIATFEMVPNVPGNTCDLPADRVVHIHVGCNPKRNIRVHRPWGLPCKIMNFTNYTIPGSVLQIPTEQDLVRGVNAPQICTTYTLKNELPFSESDKDVLGIKIKVVDYDWEKYGCLFNIYYTQPFLPSLDLYDGDVFLKSVDANFIIWEQHGRTDFSYNASMEEAYCMREAQTWKSMIAMSRNLSKKSIGEAWGPNNYRTCFEVTPGIFGDLGQPYEILNRSGNNFITWSQEQSGIYVFNVKILDPNFSFCDLRTVFTVQTYGVLTSDHSMLIATIETIFTFVVLGILIYSYFRYVKIFNTMSVINPNPDEKDKQQ